jgi:DNA modification methylase
VEGQLGLEETPEAYTERMTAVFGEVNRILRPDGTLWLNLGDSYAGNGGACPRGEHAGKNLASAELKQPNRLLPPLLKSKDLVGIPWRMAFALQAADFKCSGCEAINHQLKWGRFPNGRWICPNCNKSKGHDVIPGWYLRSDIIWHKRNPMPESVTDRPTKAHEYIFLMSKSDKYYYDHEAVKVPGKTHEYDARCRGEGRDYKKAAQPWTQGNTQRPHTGFKNVNTVDGVNRRTVWEMEDYNHLIEWLASAHPDVLSEFFTGMKPTVWDVATRPYPGAHFAVFPPELIEPCILAGTKEGDIVLDPFNGSGTVGHVCKKHKRRYIGIELNEEYLKLNPDRIGRQGVLI